MSAALVQKALEIVDPDYNKGKNGKKQTAFSLMSENQKVTKNIVKKGRKEKVGLSSSVRKISVVEAKKQLKTKEQILKENLKKLKQIKEASTIELDRETTEKIIERAVTGRPVRVKKPKKKLQKTAFTEEDFKKFEEEFLNS